MFLPYIRYPSKTQKYEQYEFGGIDRRKASADGTIFDLKNISTSDFPLLSSVPARYGDTKKYDKPLYYGVGDKPFAIYGRTSGGIYNLWQKNLKYNKGDIVAYEGILYECIQNYESDVPPVYAAEHWRQSGIFQYDGVIGYVTDYKINGIYLYEGKAYKCIKESKPIDPKANWATKTINWSDYNGSYAGEYDFSKTYSRGKIVYSVNGNKLYYYKYIAATSNYGTDLNDVSVWEKISLEHEVWNITSDYATGDVVAYKTNSYDYTEYSVYENTSGDINGAEIFEPYVYAQLDYGDKVIKGVELIESNKVCTYINDNLIIFPDKVYYNSYTDEFGYLQGTKSGIFKTAYTSYVFNSTLGGKFARSTSWLIGDSKYISQEAEGTLDTLMFGYISDRNFYDYSETYDLYDLRKIFRVGDSVNVINERVNNYHPDINNYFIIREIGKNYLRFDSRVFAGIDLSGQDTYSIKNGLWYEISDGGSLTITKVVPDLNSLCVANNRVWGCHKNVIYGSSLGNPFVWQNYTGLQTDGVYLELGTEEELTGCCEYGGYTLAFTEDKIYRVYGNTPTEFGTQAVADIGLKKGMADSICTVNSALIFLSPNGVFAYSGGVPANVSYKLNGIINSCISSTDGYKYYALMDVDGDKRLYVYDTNYGVWSSEQFDLECVGFGFYDNKLKCVDAEGNILNIKNISKNSEILKKHICEIEFNDFYNGTLASKDILRIIIRASVDPSGNALNVYVQYDSDGMWHKVGKIYNQNARKKVVDFTFAPHRCDHFRIKICCEGDFTLYSVGREVANN